MTYVRTGEIRAAVRGRETEILDALGIGFRAGRPHITCPYPDHGGVGDWRWDARKGRAYCTCIDGSDSIFDVIAKCERIDFNAAKVRAAELIGRFDLIRESKGDDEPARSTDPASLLNPPAALRDDTLPLAYLAHRLCVAEAQVPIPRTPMVGLERLAYYDPPPPGSSTRPKLVGTFPCAVFGTIAADGKRHAHRIYLAHGGGGKANLGIGPDGEPRDPKKSARVLDGDNTSGRAVLWGDPWRASWFVICEGIETASAVALAFSSEIDQGEIAVAAAISAVGVEAFQPYPITQRVTVAADRDEAPKPDVSLTRGMSGVGNR